MSAALRQTAWRAAFIALLCVSGPLFADDKNDNGTTVKAPPPPTVSMSEPAPLVNDRAKSSAAAKAAALGGAAQSRVMCFMMMSQAMQEKDKTAKAMMMMAAQQACNQANQMEQSAAENDKGMKLASGADIPKQSKLEAKGMDLPSGAPKDNNDALKGLVVSTVDDGPKPDDLPSSQLAVPDLSVFERSKEKPAPVQAGPDNSKGVKLAPDDPKQALSPIDPKQIKFDEQTKNQQVNLGSGNFNAGGGMGKGGASGGSSEGMGKAGISEVSASGGNGKGGRKRGKNDGGEAGEGSSGGGGGSEKSGGNEGFESMLAQLLGGPPSEGGSGPLSSGEVTALPPKRDPSKAGPNIFEYATFRYHKLTFEAGRVRSQPIKRTTLPAITAITRKMPAKVTEGDVAKEMNRAPATVSVASRTLPSSAPVLPANSVLKPTMSSSAGYGLNPSLTAALLGPTVPEEVSKPSTPPVK